MPNSVGWFEIYVSDIQRAKHFYENVLQIKLNYLPDPSPDGSSDLEMWSFPEAIMDLYGISGAICKASGIEPGGTGTVVYFQCEDCAVVEKRLEPYGGKLVKAKSSIGQYGFTAVGKDSEGNMIGLYSIK